MAHATRMDGSKADSLAEVSDVSRSENHEVAAGPEPLSTYVIVSPLPILSRACQYIS
jgi:hypothetical protein